MKKIFFVLFCVFICSFCFAGDYNQSQWTNDDLFDFLTSASKWRIDGTNQFEKYEKDGSFCSGYEEKGEATLGKWKVIAPNTIEITCYGNYEKIVITNITEKSYSCEKYTSYSEKPKMSKTLKTRIPLFQSLDVDSIVETGSQSEKYIIFENQMEYLVFTGDGSRLNYRESPVNGKILGKFYDGETVYVRQRTREEYTIDGKTEAWYYCISYGDIEPYGGWVFGGYIENNVQ